RASSILNEAGALDDFCVMKWRTLLEAQGKATGGKLRGLAELKKEAEKRNHWETARDADYYRAKLTSDAELFAFLFHGTPHESFRKRILKAIATEPPEFYQWKVGRGAGARVFDVAAGTVEGKEVLKTGQLGHRLACVLASDFYRPARTAALFSAIFPGEYYDPQSSPHRVHQNILRLREWFARKHLPAEIDPGPYGFRLRATGPLIIRVRASGRETRVDKIVESLRSLGVPEFKSSDVIRATGLSKRTALRILDDAVRSGKLEIERAGRSTRYRLKTTG
ncbi:MAG: hypothetical protein ABL958_06825, partial [Bdellovibrionia bacterium]